MTHTDRTRLTLIARLRQPADAEAWREFDERYRDLVLRFCHLRGLQATDADDVRQQVMLSLVESMRRFEYDPARGRFHHYLGRVVMNAISRHHQQKARRAAPLGTRVPEPADESFDARWEREWENHHIRLALDAMRASFDPKSLAVFRRLLEGAATEEAAREFALAPDAIHKIRQRVRARLQEQIAKQILEEDGTAEDGPSEGDSPEDERP